MGNNSIKRLIPITESYSAKANKILVGLFRSYIYSDNIIYTFGVAGNYHLISWKK